MEATILEVLKGVPVAAVLFFFAIQFRKDSSDAQTRYENLVNKTLDGFSQQSAEVTRVISDHSKIMQRVENKLDEKH